jgi:hypothetical protein
MIENEQQTQMDNSQELLEFFVGSVREEYERCEGASGVYGSHGVSGVNDAMSLYRKMKSEFPAQLICIAGHEGDELMWIEVVELLGIGQFNYILFGSDWNSVEAQWRFARRFLGNAEFLDVWRSSPILDFDEALSTCDLLHTKYESDKVEFVLRQHASSWTVAVRRPVESTEPRA